MASKKGSRILVGLICKETGVQNYVTERNKLNTNKFEIKKYCPKLRKHTMHKMREKLK
ncbi:50S ribosomal protein L33 [Candidatus Absconditicoccus praedator]|uniref:50S ribosomal protein L33 n=1 Tax=Candidatus Absconditicoccus praedator TaxID=2735562 RepID=UPI001E549924|nr:50S ribosomal protein L33 [Candidatus Absconditicoccus praedator]UFX83090.1 50S ribosomal protein L33 [Candidatus Absconditicoccus praedator]